MFNDVIKFKRRECDLDPLPEIWMGDTFEHRKKKLFEYIKSKTGSYPSKNMKAFREGTFAVQDSTTVKELERLAKELKKLYKIDCFQASIDRETNTAHMLFDWNERESLQSVYFNHSDYKFMSVTILRFLNLPRPAGTQRWNHYFLVLEYSEHPEIYDELLDVLKHKHLGKKYTWLSTVIHDYIVDMCQGREK